MWYINIYSNKKVYQKYRGTFIKEGCATRSLYASSGPKAEGVPTNNQRGRGSGPCRLWGGDRLNTKELMHCHSGTNNRAPRWTFTDPCKPEVRPGAREESASPAWLAASLEVQSMTLRTFLTFSKPCDIYNPVSIVLKWFEDFFNGIQKR